MNAGINYCYGILKGITVFFSDHMTFGGVDLVRELAMYFLELLSNTCMYVMRSLVKPYKYRGSVSTVTIMGGL